MKKLKFFSIVFSMILFLGMAGLVNAKTCPMTDSPCPKASTPCTMPAPCPMTQSCAQMDECPDVSSCPMVINCSKRMQEMIGKTDTYSDQRFIRTIIMHKQAEIQVTQNTLQQIQNAALKREAKKLINKDTKEIRKLQAICRKIYGK